MIHANKLFPLALKQALEEGERARIAREKREKRKADDRGPIKRNKRKEKRARAKQLTFNL